VDKLSATIAAASAGSGRRLAAARACDTLSVTVTAFRDFSCASYASFVLSLGGSGADAAVCSGNLLRVQLAQSVVQIPVGAEMVRICLLPLLRLTTGPAAPCHLLHLMPAAGQAMPAHACTRG